MDFQLSEDQAAIRDMVREFARREIVPQAEALIAATGADIRIGGNRACYVPSGDFIQMPPQQ